MGIVIEFRPRNHQTDLFQQIQQAAIDVACVGAAFLLVSTAAVGIAGIFFVVGCLVTFE